MSKVVHTNKKMEVLELSKINEYLQEIENKLNNVITGGVKGKEKATALNANDKAENILISLSNLEGETRENVFGKLVEIYRRAKEEIERIEKEEIERIEKDETKAAEKGKANGPRKEAYKIIKGMAEGILQKDAQVQSETLNEQKLAEKLEQKRDGVSKEFTRISTIKNEIAEIRKKNNGLIRKIGKYLKKIARIQEKYGLVGKSLKATQEALNEKAKELEERRQELFDKLSSDPLNLKSDELEEVERQQEDLKKDVTQFSKYFSKINSKITILYQKVISNKKLSPETKVYLSNANVWTDLKMFNDFASGKMESALQSEQNTKTDEFNDLTGNIEKLRMVSGEKISRVSSENDINRGGTTRVATQGAAIQGVATQDVAGKTRKNDKKQPKKKEKKSEEKAKNKVHEMKLQSMSIVEKRRQAKDYYMKNAKWFGAKWWLNIKYAVPGIRNFGIRKWERAYIEEKEEISIDDARNYVSQKSKNFRQEIIGHVAPQKPGKGKNYLKGFNKEYTYQELADEIGNEEYGDRT